MNMHTRLLKLLAASAFASVLLTAGCQSTEEKPKDWFEGGPMQPATADTLQMTARVLATKGRTEQAGFLLNRMLSEFPDHLGTYTEGAEILLIEGRVAEAIKWLDRGLVNYPNQPILLTVGCAICWLPIFRQQPGTLRRPTPRIQRTPTMCQIWRWRRRLPATRPARSNCGTEWCHQRMWSPTSN